MLKYVYTTMLCILFLIDGDVLKAQCIIDHDSYENGMTIGKSYASYSTTVGEEISVEIGEVSAEPQLWDFTNFNFSLMSTSECIAPEQGPLITQFPSANCVIRAETYGAFMDDNVTTYNYDLIADDAVYLLGISNEEQIMYEYQDPIVQMKFPCTYGTEWSMNADTIEIVPGMMWIVTQRNYKVDAYGTLKLPVGEYQAIRLVESDYSISVSIMGSDTSTTQSISFLTPSNVSAHLSIDPSQMGNTTINTYGIVYSVPSSEVSVRGRNDLISNEFMFCQNYPNPFNPSTKIQFAIPKTEKVSLKIYDIQGKLVKNIIDYEVMSAGTYAVEWDGTNLLGSRVVSGIYLARMEAGGFTQTKKMTLLK